MIFGRYAVHDGWILQNDGEYLDRENMRFAPNGNAIETIKFLNDLVHVHKVAPQPKNYDLDAKKIKIEFSNRHSAMVSEGSWNIEFFRNITPVEDEWDLVPLPRGPHWKEDIMHAWGDGMSIPASAKYPEEAWEFIKFLVNERPADLYYAGKVPFYKKEALSDAWDDWKSKDMAPEHKTDILKYGEKAQHFYTKFWPQWRGYGSAEESGLNALLDELYNGKIDMDQFLDRADKIINRILKRAYR
jgi:multiple sugar transport system substrate-binding protein